MSALSFSLAVLTVEKWYHCVMACLATTPLGHPLYKPVNTSKSRYIKCHRTLLHILLICTTYDPKCIEKIPSKLHNPAHIGKLSFAVSISTSKEASIVKDHNTPNKMKIYSDRLAQEDEVITAMLELEHPGARALMRSCL